MNKEVATYRAVEAARHIYRVGNISMARAAQTAAERFNVEPGAVLLHVQVAVVECDIARRIRDQMAEFAEDGGDGEVRGHSPRSCEMTTEAQSRVGGRETGTQNPPASERGN